VGGKILARYQMVYPSTLSVFYFYLDNLSSRRVVLDSVGNPVDRIRYSAWGVATMDVGSDDIRSFTGKDYDASGLIYFNARYYDPLTGRFFTEDPSRQGVNWYAYCNNNPVNLTDPDGRITGADQAHFVAGQAEAHELAFIKRDVYWSGVRDRLDQVAEVESAVAGFVPGLGVALDIYKAAAGRDFVTQKNVSAQERVEAGVMAVMGAIPIAGRIAGKVVSTVAERNLARLSELADRFALQGGIQEVSRYGLSSARKSLGVGQQIGKLAEMTDVATTGAQLSGMGVKALK
jgi:RHS repeat-associated protein